MPAGFHVASAYVDIHAEDAGLRAEIQNAIRGAVAGADPKVKLDVDASALRGKVDAALKEATSGNKGQIKLDLDASSLRSKVDAALKEATTGNRGKIKLDLDAGDLRGKIDAALTGATAGNRGKIKLDLDSADLRGKIDAALAGAGAGQKVKIGVDLDTNELRGKISALVAEAGAGQRVHIGVDIDRSALSRAEGAMGNIARDSERAFGGGSNGRGLLSAKSGLGSLSVGAVLAGLTALEPALGALIAPAKALGIASSVLVPAFMGVALGAAALVIGTRGVSTAIKGANKDSVAYGTALNNLAPAAQDFVRAVAGTGGAFTQMRLPVQQALFQGLAEQMQKMGTTALPVLTSGLAGMAGLMNTAFKGVTSTLTKLSSGANGGVLGAMFGGLQTAFKPLTAIPGQMIDMLTKISVAASPLLTRITSGIGNAMTGLTGKLDKAFTSGALQSSIDKAGASIGKFFSNFKNNDAVQQMWNNMKTQGPQVAHSLQQIAQAGLHLVNNTSGIGTAALKVGGALATIVNAIPNNMLTPILTATSGLALLSRASGGLTKVGTALRSVGQSLGFMGGTSTATTRQAAALQGLARSGNSASAAFTGGALSATAIRAQAAAMTEGSIAARTMSTRMASAGTVVGTFGASANTAGTRMAALKYGAVAVAATFVAMKGVDSVMGKIFGKPANVTQMAQGFKQFAATGQLTGITAKTLGNNFQKFGSAVQEVAHGGALDKIQNSLARGFAWTGLDAFKDKNKDLVGSVDDTLASLVKSGQSDVASKLFNNLAASAEKSGTSVSKLKSMFGGYNNALKDQAAAEKIAAASMGTFGTQAVQTQKALAQNNGEVKGLQGSLNAVGRFNASATGAQMNYNQAVSQGSNLLKKHSNALSMQNGVLNTTKPAAQAAAGAMLNIAEAAKKSGEAFVGKGDFAQAAKTYDSARASIMALGKAQGLTAAQATEFTNQIMPTDKVRLYAADVKQTAASMKTLTSAMSSGKAGQTLFNFGDATKFASTARAGLTAIGASVKTLSNGKVQVKVDTVNAQRQVGELSKVMTSLSTKGTQTLKMPTQDVSAMAKAATAMGMSVKNLGGGKIKITAQDGASAVIQGIKSKLDGLKNTKISINAPNIKGADTSVGKSLAASAKGAKSLNDTMVKTPATIQASVPKVKSLADSFTKTGKSAKDYSGTLNKIFNDPRLQAHGKGLEGFGTALGGAATKAKPLTDAMSKLTASGKNIAIAVSISGTEQIGKLTALNAVKNKNIQVSVNISGTEQIGKLTALNAVKNKNIQVSVNISGTEQIGKLTALNAVKNKIVQVSVNISGTEQINKLTALNKVNNKSIQVSVNISGAESINKLQALNKVNNKSITVSVHITGADQVTKLKALNQVNNKSITVSVHVSGADQITKLKALNQVNNKSVTVSVHVSGADQISKLKQLNTVANKHISVSVNIAGNLSQLNQLKSFPSSKHITVTVTANAGPINQLKSALAAMANKHVTVTVTANAGPINQIKSAIQGISNKTVTVTVSANAGPVNSLKSAINGIANKSVTISVTANAGPVNSLKSAISSVQGKSVTVTAVVVGLGQVQALIGAIAAVQSKTVTVTVNTVKTGSAATGGHMTSASLAPGFSSGGGSYMRSYRSAGPVVGPGSGLSDSILARISNGEFIIRASMVKKYGPEFLAGINNGAYNPMALMKKWGWKLPGFASGGSADDNDEPNSHVSDSNNTGINYPPYVPNTSTGSVSLSQLYSGAHNSAVLLVQKALKDIYPNFDYSSGPGTFGPQTQSYYSKFQKSMGFKGSDADGIPGIKSLTELMNRTGEYQIKAASTTTSYVIRWGDTLTSIARKFGTSVDALVKLNHIANPDKIYAGNTLKIPGSTTVGGPPPGVVPGTKPGDWNYLQLPNFGKLTRKQTGTGDSGDAKKDVSEIDDITLYTGASTYRDNRFFSNINGTNSDTVAGQVADATDTKSLASSLDKIRELTYKSFESGSGRDGLQNYLAQGGKIELEYEKRLQDVNKSLEDAKSTQDDLNSSYKSLVQSVGEAVQSFATITKVGGAGGSTTTMLSQMTKDAGNVTAFQQGLSALQGRGLNATTMAQIAQTGPTEGLRTVNSLLKATPEQLTQMNALQSQINTAGTKIATSAADAMYGAGIQAANGLVQGLQANQTAIQDQMKQIALAMETALKQALGIASPSKVMHQNGIWTIQGLIQGLQAEGKSVPEVIKAIVDQIHGTAQAQAGVVSAAGAGAATGTSVVAQSGGDVHIGTLHVSVDCSGMNISSPDDATKLAKALAPAVMQAIRDENRKRS